MFIFLCPLSGNKQSCSRQSGKPKAGVKRKRETETGSQREEEEDELHPEVEIDPELDRELENKSRQHNLTSANVRSIIHVSEADSYLTKKYRKRSEV